MKRIINLGAGVQSSTMLLMALRGEFGDVPDAAVFSDTQWEPKAVYEWLDWLEAEVAPFPIHRVTAGNIREEVLAKNTRYASPPFHLVNIEGNAGITRRQCTKGYKIEPLEKKVAELVGVGLCEATKRSGEPCTNAGKYLLDGGWYCGVSGHVPKEHRGPEGAVKSDVVVERWFGISVDEVQRMRDCRVPWQSYRYPLVDARLSRHSCLQWMDKNGYPRPPRSACLGCPFHSDHEWRDIRDNDPEGWADAVDFDKRIREVGLKGLNGVPYLHRSMKPLDEVDLSTAEENGQINMFNGECEGMCGV